MRIGLALPSVYASKELFPDKIFAPLELATSLTNGLVDAGHDVRVYSAPDMETRARLVSAPLDGIKSPRPYYKFRELDGDWRKMLELEFPKHAFEMQLITHAFDDLASGQIDVLHMYMDSSLFYGQYMADLVRKPVVFTLHDPLPPSGSFEFEQFSRFAKHSFVSISNAQRHSALTLHFVDTVYHGIDTALYDYDGPLTQEYLFIGRLIPEKGLEDGVKACVVSNATIQVASHFPAPHESQYVDTILSPLFEYPHLKKIGMVTDGEKVRVLGHSKALLFPIKWEEPFGMVLIEAMACGTPVIAYNHGSVPEIVVDGVTGFIVDSDDGYTNRHTGSWIIKKRGVEGLVEAMKRIGEIKRTTCRSHVQENFSNKNMVKNYEKVYSKLINSGI